ncbi:MAG: DNA polymerase III subunit chi [Paracoccaceae bacterium]
MGAAFFYHLSAGPLEATLPTLLTKARAAGWRIAVRGTDPKRLNWLDAKLWLLSDDGFLPHGIAGGEFDADQPILLTQGDATANAAACLMAIDGADITPDEVNAMERVCVLFDGNDPAAVQRARDQWKALADAGCAAQYWSQESGAWAKKAEVGS